MSAMFLLDNQDHTLGNLVRGQLLRDPDVVFAAYRLKHPTERKLEIRVETVAGTLPRTAALRAAEALACELDTFDEQFRTAAAAAARAIR